MQRRCGCRQRAVGHHLARCIDRVNLDDAFCQIGTNLCDLGSKDFFFNTAFRLNLRIQSWHLMPSPGGGKFLGIPLGAFH